MVIAAAWLKIRQLLKTPSAAEIVDEMESRGVAQGGGPSLRQLRTAVQDGINGTAERVQRIEASVARLVDQVEGLDQRVDARHAENQLAIGELRGALRIRRQ